MRFATLGLALFGLLFAACGGGGGGDASEEAGAPDFGRIVYWDELSFAPGEPSPIVAAIADQLFAADPEMALPFLIDLAYVPGPFAVRAFEELKLRFDDPLARNAFDIDGLFGAKEPADDPPEYLEFKRKLFRTIQTAYDRVLSPQLPRTVSAQEVVWGGVGIDGIPPLESPHFVTVEEAADWIRPTDEVIGLEIDGDARAYPIRIIGWHEMVNDTVGGIPVSLSYCTLCGTAIVYDGRVNDQVIRFGTSGLLYRSNKLMYDRASFTLWDQFSGEPVWGSFVALDTRLQSIPSVTSSYADWLAAHPDTLVLDIETGWIRDYGPGKAYEEYNGSPLLIFGVPEVDDRLPQKSIVFVLTVGDETRAYPVRGLDDEPIIHDTVGGEDVILLATEGGDGARAFAAEGVRIVASEGGRVTSEDGRSWTVTEAALVADDGTQLERLAGHNSFWFAVVNLAQNGSVWGLD